MFTHQSSIRVRYAETDQMGYLYYGNYAAYFEVARAEMIRSLGISYQELEENHGIMMPVMSLNMRFVRPARYDELLNMKTTLRKIPDRFIIFHTDIYNPKGKLVNGGSVKLCFVEQKTNKTVSAPKYLLEHLYPYFQNE